MVSSSFLVALQNVFCKPATPLKGDSSKFLEKLLFGTYQAPVRFLDRAGNAEFYIAWLSQVSFRFSYSWVYWTARVIKKKRYLRLFLIIFQNFNNSSFSNILSKMYEQIFYKRSFSLANFQLFQNTQRKHFSWSLYLLKSEILDCRTAMLEKKGTVLERFFGNFWIFIISFPFCALSE